MSHKPKFSDLSWWTKRKIKFEPRKQLNNNSIIEFEAHLKYKFTYSKFHMVDSYLGRGRIGYHVVRQVNKQSKRETNQAIILTWVEPNVTDQKLSFSFISIRFGSCELWHLKQALEIAKFWSMLFFCTVTWITTTFTILTLLHFTEWENSDTCKIYFIFY